MLNNQTLIQCRMPFGIRRVGQHHGRLTIWARKTADPAASPRLFLYQLSQQQRANELRLRDCWASPQPPQLPTDTWRQRRRLWRAAWVVGSDWTCHLSWNSTQNFISPVNMPDWRVFCIASAAGECVIGLCWTDEGVACFLYYFSASTDQIPKWFNVHRIDSLIIQAKVIGDDSVPNHSTSARDDLRRRRLVVWGFCASLCSDFIAFFIRCFFCSEMNLW